ncbi:MAG: glycerol-3-phosphate acyltransferase, partial [Clostridia bacterium]|nr:glycerol-3-phosphate acyltransferase [Clostridia bacterium]
MTSAVTAAVFGLRAGFLTFLGDFLKSVLAMWLGKLLVGDTGLALAGAACLVGHCFPVFFRFRGGKAVSAGAAVGLMVDWRLFLISMAVFLIVAFCWKIASVASISAAI